MVNSRLREFYELFAHFTYGEWIYETKKIYEFETRMSPEERKTFYIDPKLFDWEK